PSAPPRVAPARQPASPRVPGPGARPGPPPPWQPLRQPSPAASLRGPCPPPSTPPGGCAAWKRRNRAARRPVQALPSVRGLRFSAHPFAQDHCRALLTQIDHTGEAGMRPGPEPYPAFLFFLFFVMGLSVSSKAQLRLLGRWGGGELRHLGAIRHGWRHQHPAERLQAEPGDKEGNEDEGGRVDQRSGMLGQIIGGAGRNDFLPVQPFDELDGRDIELVAALLVEAGGRSNDRLDLLQPL